MRSQNLLSQFSKVLGQFRDTAFIRGNAAPSYTTSYHSGGGVLGFGCDGGVRPEPWTPYPSSGVIPRKSGTHG